MKTRTINPQLAIRNLVAGLVLLPALAALAQSTAPAPAQPASNPEVEEGK